MNFKRKFLFSLAGLTVFLFLITVCTLYIYTPIYLNEILCPSISKIFGMDSLSWNVRRVGFTGADIGDVTIGNNRQTTGTIESIRIDYSPKGLYQRHIDRIVLSGIQLYCEYKNQSLSLRGFDFSNLPNPSASDSAKAQDPSQNDLTLPVSIGKLELKDMSLIFLGEEELFRIPADVNITPDSNDPHAFQVYITIYPRSQRIVVTSRIELKSNHASLQIEADGIRIERFGDLIPQLRDIQLFGTLNCKAQSEFQIKPFEIISNYLTIDVQQDANQAVELKFGGSKIESNRLHLEVESVTKDSWKIATSGFSIMSPVKLHISQTQAVIITGKDGLGLTGDLEMTLDKQPIDSAIPFQVIETVRKRFEFAASLSKNKELTLKVGSPSSRKIRPIYRFRASTYDIAFKEPDITISGSGTLERPSLAFSSSFSDIHIRSSELDVKIPGLTLKANDTLQIENLNHTGRIELTSKNAVINMSGIKINVPDFSVHSDVRSTKKEQIALKANVVLNDAQFEDPVHGIQIQDVDMVLPILFPLKASDKNGSLSVDRIVWKRNAVGSLNLSFQQTSTGIAFSGKHVNRLFSGMSVALTGKSDITNLKHPSFDLTATAHHKVQPALDMGKFHPSINGFKMDGEFKLQTQVKYDQRLTGDLNINGSNIHIEHNEKKISVDGMGFDFSIPNINRVVSAPKQHLKFNNASVGPINFKEGIIEFQLEPEQAVLIEKSHFKWCEGNVSTQSLRLSPKIEDYDLVLYCDRLNLARVLEQIGAGKAKGKGIVNGRLPIRWTDGKLIFNDGFLYSIPGDGGTIYVTGAEILTAGIPKNTPQYAQIDLAREALKEFDYQWAKLIFSTQGEDLKIKMQFDGKPANPLPFVYKKELGGFARVESESSIFQGIRLDINMGLPINQLLEYKNIYDMIK